MKQVLKSILIITMLSTFLSSCSSKYGKEKNFNGVQLFYTSKVTEAQADKLGKYLISGGFADGEKKTVQITKTGNTFEFRMVVKKGIDRDEEFTQIFKSYASELSKNVFDDEPVEIHLCDENLKTLRVVVPLDESDE